MKTWLLIAVAGALGAVCRYGLSGAVHRASRGEFAWGTLTVNVAGSLLLGFLLEFALGSDRVTPEWRAAIGIGFLGAFTTFSTFSYETVRYIQDGDWVLAAANVSANIVLCLAACAAGIHAARWRLGG